MSPLLDLDTLTTLSGQVEQGRDGCVDGGGNLAHFMHKIALFH